MPPSADDPQSGTVADMPAAAPAETSHDAPTLEGSPGGEMAVRPTGEGEPHRRRRRRRRRKPPAGAGAPAAEDNGETAAEPVASADDQPRETAVGMPGAETPRQPARRRRRRRPPQLANPTAAVGPPESDLAAPSTATADGAAPAPAPWRPRHRRRPSRRPAAMAEIGADGAQSSQTAGEGPTGETARPPRRSRLRVFVPQPTPEEPAPAAREPGTRERRGRDPRSRDNRGAGAAPAERRARDEGERRERVARAKGPPGKGTPGARDRQRGLCRDEPRQRPPQKLYALESVVDRGFEDIDDAAEDSGVRRVHWTIVKRTVADQKSGKPMSATYVLQREGADTEYPNLGAARAAANKTIVHPEKLTMSKAEHVAAKNSK